MNPPESPPEAAWWVKHAPQELHQLALAPEVRRRMDDFLQRGTVDNLLFAGPPGIGKSTLAHVLVSRLPCDYCVFYASIDRGIDAIRGDLTRFVGARPWANRSLRVAVLEEADGLTPEAQRALRNVIDTAPPTARFILNMNTIEGLHTALISRCLAVDLSSPPTADRVRILRRILRAEGLAEPSGMEGLAATTTDMRELISEVERAVRLNVPLPDLSTELLNPSGDFVATTELEVPGVSSGRLRKLGRPERERLIVQELGKQEDTVGGLQRRLVAQGVDVPTPTLYEDLARLQGREVIRSEGYPKRWNPRRSRRQSTP